MIILNIYGILAIVVISFVGFYLHTYWPSLYEGSYFGLTLGVLTLLVGSVMERLGARGRIFFVPVWLVGVLLTAYAIFLLWGVVGLILPAILVIIAVWWLTKVIKKNDAPKWEKAKHWMEQFRAYKDSTDSPVFWQLVKESLFFPVGSLSSEACEHNLEIVRRVLENSPNSEAIKGIAVWYEFQELLVESIQSAKPMMMDKKRETQLVEFVSARC